MKSVKSTHSPNSRRSQRIAERQWWSGVQVRVIGGVLLLLGIGNYIQGSHIQEQGEQRQRQIDALSQALTSEQQNARNNGDTPVAPAPSQIVNNPEVIKIKGDKGDKGDPGASGVPGKPGASGASGKPGTNGTGVPGLQGEKGDPGVNGTNGKDGKDGVDGKSGEPPYGWTVYNSDGSVNMVCTREDNFDPDAPKYTCKPPADESPSPTPGETSTIGAPQ